MDCIFCKINNGDIPSYTVYENDMVRCFLDINPISTGHMLIIPKKHFKDFNDIEIEYLTEINKCAKKMLDLVNEKLKPNGIRLVQNNGVLQDVKHFHLHIIPNYSKDKKIKVEEVFDILTK